MACCFFNTESTEDTESVLEERDLEFDKRSLTCTE